MPMPVEVQSIDMNGVLIIKTGIARDARGFFSETYSQRIWSEQGFAESFVQDNLSCSARGTMRGMHYQLDPHGMGKLVRAVNGAVYDVVVDLRRGSPTFGQWRGFELSAANALTLWVPVGFAHGFVALEDNSLVHYKCTHMHTPEAERSLSYKCPVVGIQWPIEPSLITKKDEEAPGLNEADFNFVYKAQPR